MNSQQRSHAIPIGYCMSAQIITDDEYRINCMVDELITEGKLTFDNQNDTITFKRAMHHEAHTLMLMKLHNETKSLSQSHNSFFTFKENLRNFILSKRIGFFDYKHKMPPEARASENQTTDELPFEMDEE